MPQQDPIPINAGPQTEAPRKPVPPHHDPETHENLCGHVPHWAEALEANPPAENGGSS